MEPIYVKKKKKYDPILNLLRKDVKCGNRVVIIVVRASIIIATYD